MRLPDRSGRALAALVLLGGIVLLAGPGHAKAYRPTREHYFEFRARHPGLLEPNYLPFMLFRVPSRPVPRWERWLGPVARWLGRPEPGARLVFCHWSEEDLPLRVHVVPPEIEPRLQEDEIEPRRPEEYVQAVEQALAIWQRDLDGRVAFTSTERRDEAALVIRVVGGLAEVPEPDVQVLGSTRLRDACKVVGGDASSGRLRVRYRVEELKIFIADRFGLLLPSQVERVALHEIGHALGMRGHSPIPADLMFEVARDRLPRGELGAEDVNSFANLYALPNGTVYLDPEAVRPVERRALPPGTPRLVQAPHVDARLGFGVRTPAGWMRIRTTRGVVAVNGTSWDFDASVQVIVRRFESVEGYLRRYGRAHLGRGRLLRWSWKRVHGLPAAQAVVARPHGTREHITFLETGDGRVVLLIGEAPAGLHTAYAPWFDAVLESLEIVRADPPSRERLDGPGIPGLSQEPGTGETGDGGSSDSEPPGP